MALGGRIPSTRQPAAPPNRKHNAPAPAIICQASFDGAHRVWAAAEGVPAESGRASGSGSAPQVAWARGSGTSELSRSGAHPPRDLAFKHMRRACGGLLRPIAGGACRSSCPSGRIVVGCPRASAPPPVVYHRRLRVLLWGSPHGPPAGFHCPRAEPAKRLRKATLVRCGSGAHATDVGHSRGAHASTSTKRRGLEHAAVTQPPGPGGSPLERVLPFGHAPENAWSLVLKGQYFCGLNRDKDNQPTRNKTTSERALGSPLKRNTEHPASSCINGYKPAPRLLGLFPGPVLELEGGCLGVSRPNTKRLLAVGKAVGRQLLAVTKRLEGTWGRGGGGGYTPALQAQACPSPTPTALDSTSPGRSRRATGRAA
jgi:hypothetical protein|mmetsp:Transcript_48322/g.81337  ORF Transcript_48322/g.81337 Transcript_48322/m.81337 type:complete len:370 (-) Transcript_48322:293-1402(-)